MIRDKRLLVGLACGHASKCKPVRVEDQTGWATRFGRIADVLSGLTFQTLPRPKIERFSVQSNTVATLGFDLLRSCLQVEYLSGMVYRIENVPGDAYAALSEAADVAKTAMTSNTGRLLG